jgi:Raf kinase inhibitor-like YbhB/YbcL family protein
MKYGWIFGLVMLFTILSVSFFSTKSLADEIQIPPWVKNNAKWWSEGQIGDNDFVKGIQYLVQKNIIQIKTQQVMVLSSSAFENNGTIPSVYTCDGSNVSPPLAITNVPTNTQSLALIVEDPDARRETVTHWIVWNIPPQKSQFDKGEKIGFPQGITVFGTTGYGGPCPPSGTHRYFFKLYALDTMLDLGDGSTKDDLVQAMDGSYFGTSLSDGKIF